MTKTRVAQVTEAGGPFELETKELGAPGTGQVALTVRACGVCHSDAMVKEGAFPDLELPRVPGHEVIGVISEVGESVRGFAEGDRVGVGWHGGHCFVCGACRDGDFITCEKGQICGISYDGGYAERLVAPAEALARVPDDLSDVDAAPLLCAGVTTFNALRNARLRAGDLVAVQGLGGLGHLAVQFAARMGFHTVALSRGEDKKDLARELGAHEFIDSEAEDPAEALRKLGGARVVLATAPSAKAVAGVVEGLARDGQLLLIAAFDEPVPVPPLALIPQRRAIQGWPSGTAKDSEETLRFCALHGIRPMVETFSLDDVEEAYEKMQSGKVRFRSVLEM